MLLCGVETCLPGYEFHTDGRAGYHLHVILSGKGVLSVNGKQHALHFGQMFMTKPGEDSWYRADVSDPWTYCWMSYDGLNAQLYSVAAGFSPGVNWLNCNLEPSLFYAVVKRVLDKPELNLAGNLLRSGLLSEFLALAIRSEYFSVPSARREQDYSADIYVDYAVNYINANFASKTYLFERIVVALGGRTAERLFIGDISTGASGDIQSATQIARQMVTVYGMSDRLGPISFDSSSHSVFIGRDFGQTKSYSEETAALIDEEVKRIFDEASRKCESVLLDHRDLLIATAEYLLEHESMTGEVFNYLCDHGELPAPKEPDPKTEAVMEELRAAALEDAKKTEALEKSKPEEPAPGDKQEP
ncbi:MAG: AraC family ligand binding domain-containing protein [bacterium]